MEMDRIVEDKNRVIEMLRMENLGLKDENMGLRQDSLSANKRI